ncbi:MAG TPA: hypothetical protein VFI65_02290 [Streptosporangiaceae bacterium]|nr:hypothetical protein [Streptosporangiaceae bacterium]
MWRLVMAVAMAGAGLSLVLAMIVLVVTFGSGSSTHPPPGATGTRTASSHSSRDGRYRTTIVNEPKPVAGNGSASTVRFGLGLLVAQFHGVGPVRGDKFRITRPGDWGISWQFRCTQGHPGGLTVRADHTTTGNGRGEGSGRRLGNGNGKEPPGQVNKKHKKVPSGQAKKKHKKVPPGQAKKHKHRKKVPPGQARKRGYQAGSGNQNSRVTFSASGYDGRGMSWYTSDPGAHTLVVVSGCSWAIKIVLPKP